MRERTSREVRAEIIDDDGLAVPLVTPRQKVETKLAVTQTTIAGRRYVICRYEEEAKKDAPARAALVAGLERKLAQGDKALVADKGFRRFLKTPVAAASPSTAPRLRPMPVSMASSCCVPTPRSPLSRSFFDTAIFSPWRTPSRPQGAARHPPDLP